MSTPSTTETVKNPDQGRGDLQGRYLTFALANERYGLAILKVHEIVSIPNITRVPRCPEYIRGVINLRGKIVPLIDLRRKLDLKPIPYDDKTCVIIVMVQWGENVLSLGIIVDTVLEVINFDSSDIQAAPNYGERLKANFITGMGRKPQGELNILVDIESLLSPEELKVIAQVSN